VPGVGIEGGLWCWVVGRNGFIRVRSARASRILLDIRIDFRAVARAQYAGRVVMKTGKKFDLTRRGQSGEGRRVGQVTSELFVRIAAILVGSDHGDLGEELSGCVIGLLVFWESEVTVIGRAVGCGRAR
jgi:hypothetical protein